MVLHLKNSFASLKINYLMYFFKIGSFRPNQSQLDRFRLVNRFIRWTSPVTGSGFKNIGIHTGSTRGSSIYLINYVSVVSVCYCRVLGSVLGSSYCILVTVI